MDMCGTPTRQIPTTYRISSNPTSLWGDKEVGEGRD